MTATATKAARTRSARRAAAAARAQEARRNGNSTAPAATPAPEPAREVLPVASYAEASRHLRRPFTPEAVKFKVQNVWPKESPTGAMIVAYIDARLVVERLNLVCPEAWSPQFTPADRAMWCHLTVFGITRSDIGDGYVGKGLVSDSLKRAAVQFGVGVSLYATPTLRFFLNSEALVKPKKTAKGPSLELTDAGTARCRTLYRSWLTHHGIKSFGEPLDHGDVEDAVGDVEADREPEERSTPAHRTTAAAAPATTAVATPAATEQPKALTDADHEKAIGAFLAIDDDLADLRKKAEDGMQILGAGPRQRHEKFQAHADRAALESLLRSVNQILDTQSDIEPATEGQPS
jgi:hypothetical protein